MPENAAISLGRFARQVATITIESNVSAATNANAPRTCRNNSPS